MISTIASSHGTTPTEVGAVKTGALQVPRSYSVRSRPLPFRRLQMYVPARNSLALIQINRKLWAVGLCSETFRVFPA